MNELERAWMKVLQEIREVLKKEKTDEVRSITVELWLYVENPYYEICKKKFPKEKWYKCSSCEYRKACADRPYVGKEVRLEWSSLPIPNPRFEDENLGQVVKLLNKELKRDEDPTPF